ncbi:hypothetical protein DSL72_002032 [Monilinia vaccinii-corymbosi]|uniref:CFEM domain-containing protein n=1 Tax=Monilinia vaccinii-corymbosi TaxID=61207 RepID=A0A8A3PBL1_9HELO|nr:hypothetical protein DSL72_002032 [Monilinia vaccinii-corymbosi]
MKFSILALAAAATFVTAIEFPGQPACASPCLSQAISKGTNCNIEDVACQCNPANGPGLSINAIPCLLSACTGAGELSQASKAGPSLCSIFAAQGSTSAGTTSASSSAESTSASQSSSAAPASTTSSGPASTSSKSETGTSAPTTTSSPSNGTVTTSSPKSSTAGEVTQNVAHSVGVGVGAMVGLLAGVVAVL